MGRLTALRIVFGVAGLMFAINAVFVTVSVVRAGRDAMAEGDGGLDVGLIAVLIVPPCLATALALFFLRRAFRSRRP